MLHGHDMHGVGAKASACALAQEEAFVEVQILRMQVSRLQTELAATTEQLEAASAAAEAERSAQSPPL